MKVGAAVVVGATVAVGFDVDGNAVGTADGALVGGNV